MSDNNGNAAAGGNGSGRSDICHNFLNNVCFRGNRCPRFHPPEVANRNKEVIKDFCHDYQNKGCTRDSCHYIHCSRQEMEEYDRTGEITESLAKALVGATGQDKVNGRPLCKEYSSPDGCQRGICRFWHINPTEERERRQMERAAGAGGRSGGGGGYRAGGVGGGGSGGGGYGMNQYDPGYDYRRQPDYKHPHLEDDRPPAFGAVSGGMGSVHAPSPGAYMALQEKHIALQEENIAQRRKIDVLQQTVAKLSEANDNMIAENNRLRAKLQVQVPSVGGPPSINDTASILERPD